MNPQSSVNLKDLSIDELTNLKDAAVAQISLIRAQSVSATANTRVQLDRSNKQIGAQNKVITAIEAAIVEANNPVDVIPE